MLGHNLYKSLPVHTGVGYNPLGKAFMKINKVEYLLWIREENFKVI
jgi:hypothetical protein